MYWRWAKQQQARLLLHVDPHLLFGQVEHHGPEPLVGDLAQVVLDQAQVEIGLQALLDLDLLIVGQRRLEGPLGGVEVLEPELGEPAPAQRLDAIVGGQILALQDLGEDLAEAGQFSSSA